MEIQIKIDATPAAVACAESLKQLGIGLNAFSKIQLKVPKTGPAVPFACPAGETEEPASAAEETTPPITATIQPVEKPAPEPAEEPASKPARQAAAGHREARQNSGDAPAPQGGAAAPQGGAAAPQGGAAASPTELHTHADILTICAALKRDYPEDFTPAAGLQFTRDACKAAGVDSIKPTEPEAVERLYQAVAKMAATFRALQGGAANG